MAVMASLIPTLGFVVVGDLCHARIPLPGDDAWRGSKMTPSVFVPPTSTPMRRCLRESVEGILVQSRYLAAISRQKIGVMLCIKRFMYV